MADGGVGSVTGARIEERTGVRLAAVEDAIAGRDTPLVLRGLCDEWPVVQAAKRGVLEGLSYLRGFDRGAVVAVSRAGPEAEGRVFYNADLTAPNFQMGQMRLGDVFDALEGAMADPRPPLLYVGSTDADVALPGLSAANPMPLDRPGMLSSVWIGGKSRIAAHYDLPDNVACVAVGRRRFTLFAPDQMENLYVGPLDMTPAGQPVSLVDLDAPDFDRFPRFRTALAASLSAELGPGDALFIPKLWWHAVTALEGFNLLMNYWWRDVPSHLGPPFNALVHAILAVRDLPPDQRAQWRRMFDHYVFEAGPDVAAHIPAPARGILGPIDASNAKRIRTFLMNRLNR